MTAKLIKTGNEYLLRHENGKVLAISNGGKEGKKLSLKNCQAIERGYDLDELLKGFIKRTGYNDFDSYSYKLGFQKSLEILSDKKFSEEDIRKALTKGYLMKFNPSDEYQKTLSDFIQSLQQTEWDVIVEMEEIHQLKKRAGSIINMGKPKLDAGGCLILKRK